MADERTTEDVGGGPPPRPSGEWEGSRLARLRARFASPWAAIGFALAAVAAGLLVRWAMNDPGVRFVILYPTVAVAALGAELLFFAPVWASGAAIFADTVAVANFVLTGLLMSLVAAVDRTEARRMLAGALRGREVEERHRTIVEALHEGVVVFSPSGEILAANPSAERLLGLQLDALRRSYRMIGDWPLLREDETPLPPDEYPAARVLRSGRPIRGEITAYRLAGRTRWFLYNAVPIFAPDGSAIASVVISFADISERRRAEREISDGRARLKALFSVLNEGVILFAADGRVLSHNPAAERILGHPPGTLAAFPPGFRGWGLVDETGTELAIRDYPTVLAFASGEPIHGQVIGVRRGDEIAWLLNSADPMFDPETGEVAAVVVSFADITELRRAETALAESRAHLASVLEALHEAVLVFDVDGRTVSCNRSAETVLRRSAAELLEGEGFLGLGRPAVRADGTPFPVPERPIRRTLAGGPGLRGTVVGVVDPTGTFWLEVNDQPIRDPRTGELTAVVASFSDITARVERERELAESRARFAAIVSSAMDAIISVDGDQRVVLFNTAAERLFRLPAAEALGRPLADFVPPRDRARHDAAFRRFATEGPSPRGIDASADLAGLRADGTEFPFEASVSRVEIDGRPLYNIVLRDISERLAAERVDAHLAAVIRSSPDAILTFSMDGRIETWNDAATRMFGYAADEAIGRSVDFLSFPGRPDGGLAIFHRVRQGESVKVEVVRRRADGSTIEVMTSAAPIRGANGEVVAGVSILSDISERRRRERELAERDQELRQTLDAAGLGVWWIDTETGLVHCDPRSRALFAAAEVEPLDHLALRLRPEDRDVLLDLPGRADDIDAGPPRLLRRESEGGAVSWLSLTARSRRRPGHGVEIWGTVQDVTTARRAEEAMRRLEASRRLEALGRMTGGIAHDLNNLLTVVSGNLQLLEMSPGSQSAGRWIAEALRASESGAALNDRLLTFARRRRLAPSLTDLDDLVGGMVDMLHRAVGPRITVVTVLGADLGLVRIDAAEVENAVLNLVLNARDAMPEGGRIVIETSNTWVDETTAPPEEGSHFGQYVRLTVSDSGHGMAPDVKARAFEPFFTTKEIGRGSGLGLATLHGFVHQSGGFVTLYSELGRGTAVSVHLPRGDVSPEVRPAATECRPRRGRGEVVLVVEDDADVRRVTRERLEALGYRVEVAETAAAALDLVTSGRPIDLVFTDIVMPGGLSGLDLARRLRAADPKRRILVTSGFAEDFADGPQPPEFGFHFLRKPHAMVELAAAVAEALDRPSADDGPPADDDQTRDTSAVKT